MGIAENQGRVLLEFLASLRPHWRRDLALPERIDRLLRRDRRLGSRDRRLYRELIYTTLRHLPWIEPMLDRAPDQAARAIAWLAADTPATRDFRSAAGAPPGLASAPVGAKAAALAALAGPGAKESLLPAWLRKECPEAFESPNYDVLNTRAPIWIRLQTADPAAVLAEFSARGWSWRASERVPSAVALPSDAEVERTDAHGRGLIEIQDAGSQFILQAVGVEPGERWFDACAGAGGKSLQLASLLGAAGRVDACDVRAGALVELGRRAARAGLTDRIFRPAEPGDRYDAVLVDAPCSGSGTWRRAPHLKWATTAARVGAQATRQRLLLEQFSTRVRPGGRLVYATCSLCRGENEAIVAGFLTAHPEFRSAPFSRPNLGQARSPGLMIWPAAHDTDGYFCAVMRRD